MCCVPYSEDSPLLLRIKQAEGGSRRCGVRVRFQLLAKVVADRPVMLTGRTNVKIVPEDTTFARQPSVVHAPKMKSPAALTSRVPRDPQPRESLRRADYIPSRTASQSRTRGTRGTRVYREARAFAVVTCQLSPWRDSANKTSVGRTYLPTVGERGLGVRFQCCWQKHATSLPDGTCTLVSRVCRTCS